VKTWEPKAQDIGTPRLLLSTLKKIKTLKFIFSENFQNFETSRGNRVLFDSLQKAFNLRPNVIHLISHEAPGQRIIFFS